MARIVLLGATGYTGRLIAERLADGHAETVLAGRSSHALAAMADELGGGCKAATVRLDDPRTLTDLLDPGDVLVTTVGSFVDHGDVAVSAAIETVRTTWTPPGRRHSYGRSSMIRTPLAHRVCS